MKAVWRSLVTLGLLIGCGQSSSAQTVDDIVEKHLAALGGRPALEKLTSRLMTGTATLSTPGGDVSGTVELLNAPPNKSRTLLKIDLSSLGAGQVTFDQRFDGTAGYVLDSFQGNRDITGNQLENMRNAVFPSPFLNYKQLGMTLELGSREKAGERDAYLLIVKPMSGSVQRQYLDAESYLPVRVLSRVDAPPVGEIEQTTELSDYRDVDGLKVPFLVKVTTPYQTISIAITKVEHNGKVEAALFSKPVDDKGK